MQNLLDHLPKMNNLVYRQSQQKNFPIYTKTIQFSSGQNIKAITMMKYQYFKLLHSCLIMVHSHSIDAKVISQFEEADSDG